MIDPYSFIKTFYTGDGFWNPLVWIVAIAIISLIVYVIRSFGRKSYKPDTEQVKPFLSGVTEFKKEEMQVKASNLYWGFMEIMSGVYRFLKSIHTENVSDYVLWFIVVIGIFFIILVGVF